MDHGGCGSVSERQYDSGYTLEVEPEEISGVYDVEWERKREVKKATKFLALALASGVEDGLKGQGEA